MRKVALVTDGMGTLGTAICRRLHEDGFRVAVTCRAHGQAHDDWLTTQRRDGYAFSAYQADVADYGDCEWMMQKLLAEHGRLDVLVNQPGAACDSALPVMEAGDWQAVLRDHLDSMFNVTRQAIEPMLAQRWGRIVNISSIDAGQGAAGRANLTSALAGMHGFTKALALEMARSGITVNTVTPGRLRSDGEPALSGPEIQARIPVGRMGEPAELAGLVAYLVSDAAEFVTGANIPINGGEHLY